MKIKKEYRSDMICSNINFDMANKIVEKTKILDKNNIIEYYKSADGEMKVYSSFGYPIIGHNEKTCQFTRYYFDGHGSKIDGHCPKCIGKWLKKEFGITNSLFKLLGSDPT